MRNERNDRPRKKKNFKKGLQTTKKRADIYEKDQRRTLDSGMTGNVVYSNITAGLCLIIFILLVNSQCLHLNVHR